MAYLGLCRAGCLGSSTTSTRFVVSDTLDTLWCNNLVSDSKFILRIDHESKDTEEKSIVTFFEKEKIQFLQDKVWKITTLSKATYEYIQFIHKLLFTIFTHLQQIGTSRLVFVQYKVSEVPEESGGWMLESFDTRWQHQRAPSRASRRQIWNTKTRVQTKET